jgi:VIT1/CCC1 family predicted Fe2+/Mn2+ transporter
MLMFGAYFLGGLVPLSQILLFRLPEAAIMSVVFALVGLFVLGIIKAKIVKVSPLHSAFEALLLGGAASAVGIAVGHFLKVS